MGTLIVGASVAGVRTAQALRMLGYTEDIVLLGEERDPSLRQATAVEGNARRRWHAGAPAPKDEQCSAGIVGSFLALNARPASLLDEWLHQIAEPLEARRADGDGPVAPFAVNQIGHRTNNRLAKAWLDIWGSGQGIGAVDKVVPASQLIGRLRQEYEKARGNLLATLGRTAPAAA